MADFFDPDSIDSSLALGTPSTLVTTGADLGAIASTLAFSTPRVALRSAFLSGSDGSTSISVVGDGTSEADVSGGEEDTIPPAAGVNTTDVTLAAVGSTANANAASLSGQVLNLQPASATLPGVVTAGTQSFGGAKTFTGAISASNLSGTNTGNLTLATAGSTPADAGASISGQALTLQPADATHAGLVSTTTQSFAGAKTFTGAISASNLSGTNTGDQTTTAALSSSTNKNLVTDAQLTVIGNTSGTNSGDITLATVGSTPANAGASLSGQVLTLQPADATHGGAVSTGTQTIAGAKTFSAKSVHSAGINLGTNDLTEGAGVMNWAGNNGITASLFKASGGTSFSSTFAGLFYGMYGSDVAGKILLSTNISAANGGSTPGSAMLQIAPVNALDATDLVLSVQNNAAANLLQVAYNGAVAAAGEVTGAVGFTTTDGTLDSPVTGSSSGTKAFLMNATAGVSSVARVLSVANASTEVFFVFAGGDIAARDASSDIGGSSNKWRDLYLSGSTRIAATDSTGTPGAATINKSAGRSAIAAGASSVVITSSQVVASSLVFISPLARDATGLLPTVTTTTSGSFTVSTTATCTSALSFNWFVVNVL